MTSAGNSTTMQKKNQKETLPIPYYLRPNQHQRDMNLHMAELIPELGSPLGQTPMLRNRWYSPSEEYEPDVNCYISTGKNGKDELMMGKKSKQQRSKQEPSKKTDYIWMPQRGRKNSKNYLPAGYYHLSTQEAYIEIYHLFQIRRARRGLGGVFQRNKPQSELESRIHDLLHNRLISDLPDDIHAARMRVFLLRSQGGKAKAFGHATYLPVLSSVIVGGFA